MIMQPTVVIILKLYYKASVLETYGMNNVQTMLIFKI